jgi:predicted nucleotidyltransferase
MIFNESVLKALSTEIKASIVRHFLSGPPKMSEREIAAELKISHMSVNRAVNELFAMNFLRVSRAGNVNLWEQNEGSFAHAELARMMKEFPGAVRPLEHLKRTLKNGLKSRGVIKAVIYGSISAGREKPGSDIDLLVVVKDKLVKAIEPAIFKLEKECITLYGNPLSAHILSERDYAARQGLEVIKAAGKGIKII